MRPWAVLVAMLAAGCGDPRRDEAPGMEVVRTERDLLAGPAAWETIRARPGTTPRVEVLCPAISADLDGADMPALILEPPGEVRFALGEDATPARLVARVGVDQLAFRDLDEALPALRIAFEIRAGERALARQEVRLERGHHGQNVWKDLGGTPGVEITAPSELTLRCEALLPDGTPIEPPSAIRAGFGGLRLERRLERARTRSSPAGPNVVLVVMDTLRADRLSGYGYPRPTSPHLDGLAARGVTFESCYSTSSWTWPATASILTGLTPMEHGVVNEGSSFLLEQAETLAETLQLAGLTTAAWSANPIVSPRRNFDQGFERFWSAPERFERTGEFFEEVRGFLRRNAGTRFFLYLHLADPHTPLRPLEAARRLLAPDASPEFIARSDGFWRATAKGQAVRPGGALALDELVAHEDRARLSELYDACVWSGDHWLGELLSELARLGLEDETVVAFTSDHGEELFERGILGHGQSLKRELVRVPLVLAGPGVPRGKRHAGLASARVVAPLLAGLGGVDFPGAAQALQALDQPGHLEESVLFTTTKGFWKGRNRVRILGLTDGEWKLDFAANGSPWASEGIAEGDVELFRVAHDPGELEDLSATHPEEVERLKALLLERMSALESTRLGAEVPAGGATLHMLQQLGY